MVLQVFDYICLCCSAAIAGIHVALAVGIILNRWRDLSTVERASERELSVSVVIPARDEEEGLPTLLASLKRQTMAGFETVLVDDRSSDRTAEMMEEYKSHDPKHVVVVHNKEEPREMNGKQHALEIGLQAATGDIVLLTDSDCDLPSEWVQLMSAYFQDDRVGAVFGQVVPKAQATFFERFQSFDQLLINQWSSGTAGLGVATSCFGNNFACRKTALSEIGGFKGLGFTLVEDAALISALANQTKWRIRVSTSPRAIIHPAAQTTWKDFLIQHTRWTEGAFYHPDWVPRQEYRFVVLFLVASLIALPFGILHPFLLILSAASFFSVALMGLLAGLLYAAQRRYFLRYVPYTIFFMFFYSLTVVLGMLAVPVAWKGSKLKEQ